MKKIILGSLVLSLLCFAEVRETTIACQSLEDLKMVNAQLKDELKIEDIYKYTIEYNCKVLEVGDQIKVIGQTIENKYIQVYSNKLKSNYYTLNNSVQEKSNNSRTSVSGSIAIGHEFGNDYRIREDLRRDAKDKVKDRKVK